MKRNSEVPFQFFKSLKFDYIYFLNRSECVVNIINYSIFTQRPDIVFWVFKTGVVLFQFVVVFLISEVQRTISSFFIYLFPVVI